MRKPVSDARSPLRALIASESQSPPSCRHERHFRVYGGGYLSSSEHMHPRSLETRTSNSVGPSMYDWNARIQCAKGPRMRGLAEPRRIRRGYKAQDISTYHGKFSLRAIAQNSQHPTVKFVLARYLRNLEAKIPTENCWPISSWSVFMDITVPTGSFPDMSCIQSRLPEQGDSHQHYYLSFASTPKCV